MTVVLDASAAVAALVDDGPEGRWVAATLGGQDLAAPHLLPVEVAGVLRRAVLAGDLADAVAALAHADLLRLRTELFPYEPYAGRVWQLRWQVTAHDAWYVALAESLDASLVTLDRRLARAAGPRCTFRVPPRRALR